MPRAWLSFLIRGGSALALALLAACGGGGGGYSGDSGGGNAGAAPVFTSQPAAATVTSGQTVSFSAAASGTPVPSLQWERSADGTAWSTVPGATGASLSFTAAKADNSAQVRSRASNSYGSATSTPATLSVQWAPVILLQPASQTVASPGSAAFAIEMDSNPAASCQWQSSLDGATWQDIPGATSPGYSTGATAGAMDNLQFRCVCSNPVGVTLSQTATLRVDTTAFPLTVNLAAGAAGSPTAGASYAAGSVVGYAYSAQPGYTGLQVLLDGAAVPASGTFAMTGARTLSVSATPLPSQRTVSFTAGPGGSVSGSLLQSVPDGGATTPVTAVPASGYTFVNWTGAGFATGTANPLVVSGVLQDLAIAANFAPAASFTITATAGVWGDISPRGAVTVAAGGSATFTITADAYYVISDVKVDGVSVGAVGSYTFNNVQASHTISATFY